MIQKLTSTACAFLMLTFAATAIAGETIASGSFVGASNHVTTGKAEIVKSDSGYQLILDDAFSLDGAPDPKMAFGADGIERSTIFAPLASLSGRQVYDIPAGIDPQAFNEVYVWCERFDVPLGVAKLQSN